MKRPIACILAAILLLAAFGRPAQGDDPQREYQIKAAFIYNFLLFTEWPDEAFADSKSPFVVATVGQDPFRGSLDKILQGKQVNGRGIRIEHFPNPGAIGKCHVLFVGPPERSELRQVLDKASPTTLTIGDFDEFTAERGMLRLFPEGTNIRFEINLEAVKQGKLRVSSKLLKLAKIYGQ